MGTVEHPAQGSARVQRHPYMALPPHHHRHAVDELPVVHGDVRHSGVARLTVDGATRVVRGGHPVVDQVEPVSDSETLDRVLAAARSSAYAASDAVRFGSAKNIS